MEAIIRVHYPDMSKKIIEQAMEKFYWIRSLDELHKKPRTSELLDWLQALVVGGIDPKCLATEIRF
jgi:MoxR-like ATPase